MAPLSITFNGSGTPSVSDPVLLQQLEQGANGQSLQDALSILNQLSQDSYQGVPNGAPAGQPLNFMLNNQASITLPNPGGVLDQLQPDMGNGQSVNTAAVVQDVQGFVSSALTKLQPTDTMANLASKTDLGTLLNPQIQDLLSGPAYQMYMQMPKADKLQYQLQMQMEWQTRLETLMTNLLKMHHDTMMSIIGNIRSS
jgi:hypothetical protein